MTVFYLRLMCKRCLVTTWILFWPEMLIQLTGILPDFYFWFLLSIDWIMWLLSLPFIFVVLRHWFALWIEQRGSCTHTQPPKEKWTKRITPNRDESLSLVYFLSWSHVCLFHMYLRKSIARKWYLVKQTSEEIHKELGGFQGVTFLLEVGCGYRSHAARFREQINA